MKQFISGMLVAAVAFMAYACTTAGAGSGSNGADTVVMKVNDRPITAQELVSSPYMRSALREYIFYEAIKNEAKKYNAKVDEADFNKQIEDQKKNVELQMGMKWADFLKQNGMSEKEFIDRNRDQQLFKALGEARIKVTPEEAKKVWTDDKQQLIDQYAQQNHLPDSDKAKVTYEQVQKLAEDRVRQQKSMMMQGEVVGDAILAANLKVVAVKDPNEAKRLEDLILNNSKEEAKKQVEQSKKQQEEALHPKPATPAGGPGGMPQASGPNGQKSPPPGAGGQKSPPPGAGQKTPPIGKGGK
jgi:hypothetical protein